MSTIFIRNPQFLILILILPIPSLKVGKIFIWLETNTTNNSTLWQSSNNYNDIRLEMYYAFAKLKSVAKKFEAIIFFRNLV